MAVISANERHLEANRRNIGGASFAPALVALSD
jgi:hypothetical protein